MRYFMGDIIQIRYNKSFAYSTTTLLSILFSFLAFRTFQLNGDDLWIMLSFDAFFALFILVVVIKYLVPAIRRRTALELNEHAIIDLVGHRVATWGNIRSIRLITLYGVLTPGIAVELVDKEMFLQKLNRFQKPLAKIIQLSYKTPFIIPLHYISGDIKEIFTIVDNYLQRSKNSVQGE